MSDRRDAGAATAGAGFAVDGDDFYVVIIYRDLESRYCTYLPELDRDHWYTARSVDELMGEVDAALKASPRVKQPASGEFQYFIAERCLVQQ